MTSFWGPGKRARNPKRPPWQPSPGMPDIDLGRWEPPGLGSPDWGTKRLPWGSGPGIPELDNPGWWPSPPTPDIGLDPWEPPGLGPPDDGNKRPPLDLFPGIPEHDPYADWVNRSNPRWGNLPDSPPSNAFDFTDILEQEPEIPFQGALNRANLTPNQLRFFRSQRENIFKQFQAQLDEQFRRGVIPSDTATDFFRNFDFNREFQRTPPSQRFGGETGRFAPPTRMSRRRRRSR